MGRITTKWPDGENSAIENSKCTLLDILNEDKIKDHLLLEASASHVNNSRVQQARTICRNKERLLKFYTLTISLQPVYIFNTEIYLEICEYPMFFFAFFFFCQFIYKHLKISLLHVYILSLVLLRLKTFSLK